MKIRNGFVSNSSSSSFIVAFSKKPETADDVHKMMFGGTKLRALNYYDYNSDTVQISEQVFRDIKEASVKEMTKSLSCGWFDGRVDSYEKTKHLSYQVPEERKEIDKIYNDCDEQNDKIAANIVKKFQADNKESFFVVFEYGDHDGAFFSIMEHGGIFDKLGHIQTSYH